MAKLEQLEFPYNLLFRISLGDLKVENKKLIQTLIIKETILCKFLKFIGVIKNGKTKEKK